MLRSLVVAILLTTCSIAAEPPWESNTPIVSVQKHVYLKHPKPRTAIVVNREYVGAKLELKEERKQETLDDVYDGTQARWSHDNGRTWTDFVPQGKSTNVNYDGVIVWEGSLTRAYDPASGRLVEMWLRQIQHAGIFHNFTYCRHSRDQGRTWSEPKQLKYEEGDEFDSRHPLRPSFLRANQGMFGSSILVRPDGTLLHCVGHASAPRDPDNEIRSWKLGSLCFRGRWDTAAGDYRWEPGQRVEISPDVSSRGLMEPDLAELSGDRLLVVWRGSSTPSTPGRKWFSISRDGGRTLPPPAEWKYSDGSRFYSPSSYHRFVRHSSGKLLWIGNICAARPQGNSPRYPLVIGQVDDKAAALKRETITAIDDRQPEQGPNLQLSNFYPLENRETHAIEFFLTKYGQDRDPKNWASADSYRYVLQLR